MLASFYLIAYQVCSQWRAAEREVHPEGHTMSTASGQVSVREIVALLRRWQVRLLAGESGLARPVSWAATMRARLPAFEGFAGGELALLTLGTLRVLRAQVMELTLPIVVEQLAEIGVSAIAIGGLSEEHAPAAEDASALAEARARAERLALPLLALPAVHLAEVENEVIAHIVARREQLPTPSEAPDAYAARVRASLRAEALDALLTGTYAGEAAMRVRAAQLGYDLTQPHAVLWVELPRGALHDGSPAHVAEALGAGLGAWSAPGEGQVAALVPLPVAERPLGDVVERADRLLKQVLGNGAGDPSWSAGLGEPAAAPAQVHRAATEARDAARLGLLLFGPRRIAVPADLGVYRLLLALRDDGSLAPFVERTLAPLLADTRTGPALVETLEALFACNGNLSQAAKRLHLHRNSLIYRLNRARELLAHDLDDPELRLALQLAIKGRKVLEL